MKLNARDLVVLAVVLPLASVTSSGGANAAAWPKATKSKGPAIYPSPDDPRFQKKMEALARKCPENLGAGAAHPHGHSAHASLTLIVVHDTKMGHGKYTLKTSKHVCGGMKIRNDGKAVLIGNNGLYNKHYLDPYETDSPRAINYIALNIG
jgi:hypothetical protein